MAFGSMGTGAAKGYQWLQEQRLKAAQLAQQANQAAMQDQLARDQMASREAMQTEQLNAAAAEKEAQREHEAGMQSERLGAEAANREEERGEKRRQFDLAREDKLAQQQYDNERQATLDEWTARLNEEELSAKEQRRLEAQEQVRKLTMQNDEQLRQNEEKKRLYETTPMELYISALETKGSNGQSTGCNFPGANAAAAKRLGVKSIDYSGMDQNGIFVIKGVSQDDKPFIKQYSPEWMESAANYLYGENNPVSAKGKSRREVEEYRQERAIDQENYEKNLGARSLSDYAAKLSMAVAQGFADEEDAKKSLELYKKLYPESSEAKPKPKPTPAPNPAGGQQGGNGGARTQRTQRAQTQQPRRLTDDQRAELAALKGSLGEGGGNGGAGGETQTQQPRIPGVGGNGVTQPQGGAGADGQTQQTAQSGGQQTTQKPYKDMTKAERVASLPSKDDVVAEYKADGVDAGAVERAYNVARGKYLRGEAGDRSFDSLVTEQLAWQMMRSQSRSQRRGRQ